ncbi:unnamed protein product [Brassica oleracea]
MLDMERVGELKRHRDEMMGHFGGYLNDFQEFEPVVRPPTMESNYPLLEIEEVVAAGDDEAGSSSFRGVSHPPEKPSIAEEPATSLSPFSTARATSLQSHRQGTHMRHNRPNLSIVSVKEFNTLKNKELKKT